MVTSDHYIFYYHYLNTKNECANILCLSNSILGSYILKAYYQYEALNVYRFDHQYGKLKLSDWMKFQKSFPCETNNFVDKMCAYKKVSVTELLYHRGQNDVLLIQLIV